ncbi:MAG TPA: glycosyltransferase family 4 protein, partial [Pyrinomonadaceae bacterium]|nr:glycosyltransferase family 4 protein [Pyrinomonadaceae bacterium]
MHIVIVDTTLTTPPTGGAQTFLINLVETLVRRGYQVSVVTQPGPELTIAEALKLAGASVHMNLWSSAHLPEEKAARLAKWVNAITDEVIYVVSISPDVGWVTLPLLNAAIATLSIAHNDVEAFYDPVTHYAPLVDCAVGVSVETARRLSSETGLPADRVKYIPYGVHAITKAEVVERIASGSKPGSPLRIGYIGRVVEEQKRVMDFIPLLRNLHTLEMPFELNIIGEGDDRVRLEQSLADNDLDEKVNFWGWQTPEQIKQHLLELDVFVLLSDYEGLPVAMLEAMGYGLAPVVTRINSGNSQLIREGENGLMFAVGDMAACAVHLRKLASDNEMLRSLRLSAWETAAAYSVERMVDNYEDCFRKISGPDFSRQHRLEASKPYPLLPACKSRYPFWLRKVKS